MAEEVKTEEIKELIATTFEREDIWKTWSEEQKEAKKQEILDRARTWAPLTQYDGQYRDPLSSAGGGFELRDDAQKAILRSAIGELVSVSGFDALNLTKFILLDGRKKDAGWRFQPDSHQFPY